MPTEDAQADGPGQRHPRPALAATAVVTTALGAGGQVLREIQVELLERTALTIRIPEGTWSLTLVGTTAETPRHRVKLGPDGRLGGRGTCACDLRHR